MNIKLKFILGALAILLLFYMAFSFTLNTFDFTQWHEMERAFLVFLVILSWLILLAYLDS